MLKKSSRKNIQRNRKTSKQANTKHYGIGSRKKNWPWNMISTYINLMREKHSYQKKTSNKQKYDADEEVSERKIYTRFRFQSVGNSRINQKWEKRKREQE